MVLLGSEFTSRQIGHRIGTATNSRKVAPASVELLTHKWERYISHVVRQRERNNRNTYDPKTTSEAYKGLIAPINIRVALLNGITAQIAPNNLPSAQGRLIPHHPASICGRQLVPILGENLFEYLAYTTIKLSIFTYEIVNKHFSYDFQRTSLLCKKYKM